MLNSESIKNTLALATSQLNSEVAKFEAQLLMQHTLNVNRAWLIAHENDTLQPHIHEVFEALLNRRLRGEPMAYILGSREFYGLDLMVTPDTLIPRPDTETLVEAALAKILNTTNQLILDLGTGSGAIALAIAKSCPQSCIVAVDTSKGALEVAKKNAQNLNVTNIKFVLGNWYNNVSNQQFYLIVSNPPYIKDHDIHLTKGDLRFEPMSALASGADGLDDIRLIIKDCLIHLKPQGWLMLEHGYNQADQVANLMADVGLTNIESIKDLGNNARVTIGKNPLIVSNHWD
jgi:release factor glutamine methyltransferase